MVPLGERWVCNRKIALSLLHFRVILSGLMSELCLCLVRAGSTPLCNGGPDTWCIPVDEAGWVPSQLSALPK